jgi:hypothetical protein
MAYQFTVAKKQASKLRLAIEGASGYGKTMTALALMENLVGPGKYLVVDTENMSASLYADQYTFSILPMPWRKEYLEQGIPDPKYPERGYHPDNYIHALDLAEQSGVFDGIIFDSLSHEWDGPFGMLDMVDKLTDAAKSRNKFGVGWKVMSPKHQTLIYRLLSSPMHVIWTVRLKQDYALEGGEVKKIGMGSVQREGLDYEATIVLRMHSLATASVPKTRCPLLAGKILEKPGTTPELYDILTEWLNSEDGAKAAEELDAKAEQVQSEMAEAENDAE